MDFDISENPIGLVFAVVAGIVGFVIAGVYTHELKMITPLKYFYGILSAASCAIAGYLVARPS